MQEIQWVIFLDHKPISKAIDSLEEAKRLASGAELPADRIRIEGFTVQAGQPTGISVYTYDAGSGDWIEVE
jgi:hypothetical protein